MDYKLTYNIPKMKGRSNAFWYEGVIATINMGTKQYEAMACGSIRVCRAQHQPAETMNWGQIAREAQDDRGLEQLVGAGGESDKPYYWDEQNWFEVVNSHNGDSGSAVFEYDDAIAELKRIALNDNKLVAPDR
jgi:hypothetical protein